MKIDLVIPYVDSSDSNWKFLFNQYNPIKDKEIEGINAPNRFRGQGNFFKFWFRCVEKNMPWINKIHLVVQSESQVPKWINRDKVHIVYHEDIIPEQYLPTFNSTCIEMFLWRIPTLEEYFIYANDDFYAFNPLKPEWFFVEDEGKIKVKNKNLANKFNNSMYQNHSFKAYCLTYNKDFEKLRQEKHFIFPSYPHCMRPYIRSHMEKTFYNYEKQILESLSKFREEKNINIYLFDNCLIKDRLQKYREEIKSFVISSNTSYSDLLVILNNNNINMLALQDNSNSSNIYENYTIINNFNKRFGSKSKYEI